MAWCGLTEADAAAAGRAVATATFPWGASGRALTLDRPEGVTKLVVDPSTEQILGVGIAGTGAGELIAEGVLAVEQQATASDLASAIHPHPTLSETLTEAATPFSAAACICPARGVSRERAPFGRVGRFARAKLLRRGVFRARNPCDAPCQPGAWAEQASACSCAW